MLFVDTLSITIPISAYRRASVDEQISNANEAFFGDLVLMDATKTGYKEFYRLEAGSARVADIFIKPNRVSNSYIRIEYSPKNIRHSGRLMLGRFLQYILSDCWQQDFCDGNLTRIDLTVDVPRIPLHQLVIKDRRGNRKSKIIRGTSEEVESYYFPAYGNKQLLVYNKLQESIDNDRVELQRNRILANKTRFEYKQRNLRGYTLNNFFEKQINHNPFKKFDIKQFAFNAGSTLSEDQQSIYFDLLRYRNIQVVLSNIKNNEIRKSVEQFYNSLPKPNFFKFNILIWHGLRHALYSALPTLYEEVIS